jgi:hypothetical protein
MVAQHATQTQETPLLPSCTTTTIFKYKTRKDRIDGSEIKRIYVRDQSQYMLDVDEVPLLVGDFGGSVNDRGC